MIWLGEPIYLGHFVTEEMLRQLAAKGIVDYDPSSGTAKFIYAGIQAYRDGSARSRHCGSISTSSTSLIQTIPAALRWFCKKSSTASG
jgi:hypothetical protein